jgi:inhibitor of cysteine peptidase
MRFRFATGAIVLVLMTPSWNGLIMAQAGGGTVSVAEDANGKTIELSKGQNLVIRLPAQLGTGFSWAVRDTTGVTTHLVQPKVEDGTGVPGGVETQVFVFRPTTAGSGKIELSYQQPWMRDGPPAKTFNLNFKIN